MSAVLPVAGATAAVLLLLVVRAFGRRLVSDKPARDKHCPGLPVDGESLSLDEWRLWDGIERHFETVTAAEPRRSR